jgi:Domain of unknown function (DUF932)
MAQASLVLHCGAREVTRSELDAVPCPKPEGRWVPVPHGTVLTHALDALTHAGYEVERMQLGLSRNDARFFGTLTLKSGLVSGVQLAVGVRSSLDKSLSLQWACGARVFVCDNLAFRSERIIARKHTTHGVTRYQEAICKAVSELADFRAQEAERIRRMQQRIVSDHFAEAFLLRAYQDEGILSPRSLPVALKEWREPSFEDFGEKNLWRLYNAVTYALGKKVQTNPQAHAAATIRLGGLLEVPAEGYPRRAVETAATA